MVGRRAERRRVGALDPAEPVLVVCGPIGIGKTALLDDAADRAVTAGRRVVRAHGSDAESALDHAGLHQLLRSVDLATLPPPQRDALRQAFALTGHDGPPDLRQLGLAVLDILSGWAPVLLVVDDADRMDRATLRVLAFAARRLSGEPVTLLLGARAPVPEFDRGFPVLTVGPLDESDAGALLDAQPNAPTSRRRRRMRLAHAMGNPLVLLEPASIHLFAGPANALSDDLFRTLLPYAAADDRDVRVHLPGLPPDLFTPDGRFLHPLARGAVYFRATVEQRREAHLTLADQLHAEPIRRGFHLAVSAAGKDPLLAEELERCVEHAVRDGAGELGAFVLERAAGLVRDPDEAARLLVESARLAVCSGQIAWVQDLAVQVRRRTADLDMNASAAIAVGRLAVLSDRHAVVFDQLTRAVHEYATVRPDAALQLTASAAVVAYYAGDDHLRSRVDDLLAQIPETGESAWLRTWAQTLVDPVRPQPAPATPAPRYAAGVMAWLRDDLPAAVAALDEYVDRSGVAPPEPDLLTDGAVRAYVERGRWGRARQLCDQISQLGTTTGVVFAVACAEAASAAILAMQGQGAKARDLATAALGRVDPLESRAVVVHARRALALAAIADGDAETGWEHLRAVFTADGDPVHHHASYPALGDLAAVAVRAGQRTVASEIVERSATRLGKRASPRLAAMIERARGLLADDAEKHLRAALTEPALPYWPFEHAQTLLDLAVWLRRRRRISEARVPLGEALEIFERLGARPWADLARAESRAAGLDVAAPVPAGLAELSPQQQEIVRLAARGLTNREIGEKLFLSPRTVGSHLYRTFPKLGITARAQLRDLLPPG